MRRAQRLARLLLVDLLEGQLSVCGERRLSAAVTALAFGRDLDLWQIAKLHTETKELWAAGSLIYRLPADFPQLVEEEARRCPT